MTPLRSGKDEPTRLVSLGPREQLVGPPPYAVSHETVREPSSDEAGVGGVTTSRGLYLSPREVWQSSGRTIGIRDEDSRSS